MSVTTLTRVPDFQPTAVPQCSGFGPGEQWGIWASPTILAWPPELLPPGYRAATLNPQTAGGLSYALRLSYRDDAGALREEHLPVRPGGTLPPHLITANPYLRDCLALYLTNESGRPLLSEDQLRRALTGAVVLTQGQQDTAGAPVEWTHTGVQIWPVIDALYGAAAARDGSAPLGVTWTPAGAAHAGPARHAASGPQEGSPRTATGTDDVTSGVRSTSAAQSASTAPRPSFALWAPTACDVTLLSWETGDPLGAAGVGVAPPRRTPASRDTAEPWDGRWVVDNSDGQIGAGCQYLWEVTVYVPERGDWVTSTVTDPYSVALTCDSQRSVAVCLDPAVTPELAPASWLAPAPQVEQDASRAIYELHVRDFSAADDTCPEQWRGRYLAFTADSRGTRHLRHLAAQGLDTVHLLPVFDHCSIPEDPAQQRQVTISRPLSPASRQPQADIAAVRHQDPYNWGYDPWHWLSPEGSYATPEAINGGPRCAQVRAMIGALHEMGLQVVVDQVFNHTAASGQGAHSVLDRIVPGYYYRYGRDGRVETSAAGSNIATERVMAERLMIDACVAWVEHYRVDGFRFDLMGYHSADTMRRLARAVRDAAAARGAAHPFLYGEGWNCGEVADNALFYQATQGQLAGAGIGTFNDRLRDAVRGGGAFDLDPRRWQGVGSGLAGPSNGWDDRSEAERHGDLAWRTDLIRLAMAGNLEDLRLPGAWGERPAAEVRYGPGPAAYGQDPCETINYVDSHDNETLADALAYKLPATMPAEQRVRMNTICLATTALGQSPLLWGAGVDMLRSKSLDRDSYDSGDWFNAIDWSMTDNGFGRGLPGAWRNMDSWAIQAQVLTASQLRPEPQHIRMAHEQACELLRLRRSTPLLSLGRASLIRERVSFPAEANRPGVIVMLIDDGAGAGDIDPRLDGVMVVINATGTDLQLEIPTATGRYFQLSPIQAQGCDPVVARCSFHAASGVLSIPARTAAVLEEA